MQKINVDRRRPTRTEWRKRRTRRRLGILALIVLVPVLVAVIAHRAAVPKVSEIEHGSMARGTETYRAPIESPASVSAPSPTPAPEPIEDQIASLVADTHGTYLTLEAIEASIEGPYREQIVSAITGLLEYPSLVGTLRQIVTQEIGGLTDAKAYSTANMERAAVVWCILNRADSQAAKGTTDLAVGEHVMYVATYPNAFAYIPGGAQFDGTQELVEDVLCRWVLERYLGPSAAAETIGRVLPLEYHFFGGDGKHNIFRTEWRGGVRWEWFLPDPYAQ